MSKKYKFTVHKATHFMNLQRVAIQIEVTKKWDGKTDLSIEEQMLKNDELLTYSSLIACSTGKLPKNYDEFASMDGDEVEEWIQEAAKLNPRWFSDFLSPEEVGEGEDQEKKT